MEIVAYLLIFFRISSFFIGTTNMYPEGTPNIAKIIISFVLSLSISLTVMGNLNLETLNNIQIGLLFINEIITGLLLGYMVNLCFNAIRLGGSLIANQMGLSMVSLYDQNSKSNSTVIESFILWLFLIVFFILDGHHAIIKGVISSFKIIPIGEIFFYGANVEYIIDIFIHYFKIGIQISLPVLATLILVELIMGIISRSIPQINLLIIDLPLKILVGLIIVLLYLPYLVNEFIEIINKIPFLFDGTLGMLPMGAMLLSQEKTEKPTEKKKKDSRKKGNVAKSKEIITAFTFIAAIIFIKVFWQSFVYNITSFINLYLNMCNYDYDTLNLEYIALNFVLNLAKIFLPIAATILIIGILLNYIQVGFIFSLESIKFDIKKIDPIKGFRNIFSLKNLGVLVKDLLIIIILIVIGYDFIKDSYKSMITLSNINVEKVLFIFFDILISLFTKIGIALVFIGVLDFIYSKFIYNKKLKMTKQELKDEFKENEGDPIIKSRISQIRRYFATKRMMKNLETANVIIINPTHISVALKYNSEKDKVPIVVAKGADYLALKIREKAKQNKIPIIEEKDLARLIYYKVEVGKEIPVHMYEAVARILVTIYKLKNKI